MNFAGIGLAILLVASANIGFPLGVPPAKEDPLMARVIPGDVLMVASWAGVAALEPEADPTQKWMAQEEIHTFLLKLTDVWKIHATKKKSAIDEQQTIAIRNLLTKVTETSLTNATTIYVRKFELDGQPESLRAAAIVALKKRKQVVVDLLTGVLSGNEENARSRILRVKRNGVERLVYRDPRSNLTTEIAIWNDYFIVGIGEGELDRLIANSQTDPPRWYMDFRQQLQVEKFCSMSYLAKDVVLKIPREAWLIPGRRPLDSFRGMFMISGLDDHGMLTRGIIEVDIDKNGIEDLIQTEPLDDKYFSRLPLRPTLSASVRVSIDEVIQQLAEIGDQVGGDPIEHADQLVRKELGVGLKDELLDLLDGHIGFHYTLDADRPFDQAVMTIGISEDMQFAALHETVLESIRKWGRREEKELQVVRHGLHEIYSLPQVRNFWGPRNLVWANVKEELIFGTDVESVKLQVDRITAGQTFADTDACKDLIQFGQKNQFGNPVAISTIDPAAIAREVLKFLDRFVGDDDKTIVPGLTYGDIPDVDVLTNGVQPNVMGVYRTKQGFQLYSRQTLPGASPVVSFMAAGAMGGVAELDRLVLNETRESQSNLRQLALACLNFESTTRRLPATGTENEDGKPLLSWRVHILPYLDEAALYDQFHLDESWDSPHNKSLISKMPPLFRRPGLDLDEGKTVYLGVAGKNGPFGELSPTSGATQIRHITDGTSNTVLIVECGKQAAQFWTRPVDLSVDGEEALAATKDVIDGITNVAMCDGSVHRLKRISAGVWTSLLNMRDGKRVKLEDYWPANAAAKAKP